MSHKDIDVLILISHFFIGNLLYKILDFYSDNNPGSPTMY